MRHLVFFLLLSSVCYFTLSEVVDNNFSKCKKFFLNDSPPDFKPPTGVLVKHICQCLWNDNDEQIYLYATLYSTTWKIPIFSAYVFGSKNIGRCDVWYIEPQLDKDVEPCMQPKGYGQKIGINQAVLKDYKKSNYDKGHLYPVLHTDNHLSMLATSTLTNAAPQNPTFNQKVWLKHEEKVIADLMNCDKAYVLTGVVPDTNIKINNRVTVSKYYWRATYCRGTYPPEERGYYGPNNTGLVEELTIEALEGKLNEFYGIKQFRIFPKPDSRKRPRN